MILLDVKMQDNVDCVFEELGACCSSVFCDLSDNDEHDILLLGQPPQDIDAFSYLHGASRQGGHRIRIYCLYRIDDKHLYLRLIDVRKYRTDIRFEE